MNEQGIFVFVDAEIGIDIKLAIDFILTPFPTTLRKIHRNERGIYDYTNLFTFYSLNLFTMSKNIISTTSWRELLSKLFIVYTCP